MDKKPFDATVRIRDATAVFELVGDIDSEAADRLDQAYSQATAVADLVLDFTRVEYINSSGIALVVGVLAKARVAGQRVTAFGLTAHYRHIFEITRLSDYMTIHDQPPATLRAQATAS